MASGQVTQLRAVAGAANVTGDNIKDHMDDATSHRKISDATTTTTTLWSSKKTSDELATKADLVGGATAGDIATLDAQGNLTDSGIKFSDSETTNVNVWSAAKTQNRIHTAITGLDFQADVLSIQSLVTDDPGTPVTGDRYILSNVAALHATFGTIVGVGNGDIVEFDGTNFVISYDVSVSGPGALTWDRGADRYDFWNGSTWSEFGGLI